MDTFDISEHSVEEFIQKWRRVRPEYLTGYVGGVIALARLATERGVELAAPKAIGVTAGPLLPAQRKEIQSYVRAPVYDHYRTSEANWLAGECAQQDGLHLFQDIKRIEILRDGKATAPGDDGEIIVTDLGNRVFPIIRYATGDVSSTIEGACGCGRPHPRIRPVQGRVIDFLSLPSGKVIVGGLTGTFAGLDEYVRQFQIYQSADFDIEVRVMLTDHPGAVSAAEERVARLRANVGGEAAVSMRVVDHIAAPKGKLRYILSDAPPVAGTTPISG
jgi:phenylacetate-CoA ligase